MKKAVVPRIAAASVVSTWGLFEQNASPTSSATPVHVAVVAR